MYMLYSHVPPHFFITYFIPLLTFGEGEPFIKNPQYEVSSNLLLFRGVHLLVSNAVYVGVKTPTRVLEQRVISIYRVVYKMYYSEDLSCKVFRIVGGNFTICMI